MSGEFMDDPCARQEDNGVCGGSFITSHHSEFNIRLQATLAEPFVNANVLQFVLYYYKIDPWLTEHVY